MTAKNFLIAMGIAIAAGAALPAAASAAPAGYDNPIARLESRLCPGVTGLRTDAALQIIDRIRHDAERVGIALGDPDVCKPNMLIFFVDDAAETLDSLMERQPDLFDGLSNAERRELKNDDGPARAWNQVATRTRDGMKIYDPENLVQIPRTSMWGAHSKIYVPVRRDIVTTVVLFDSQEVVGKSLTQLADYAAMRALSNDFSAYPQDRSSILKLFDGNTAPAELTQTDLVFLKTLYSGIPNMPRQSKERSLANALDGQAGS